MIIKADPEQAYFRVPDAARYLGCTEAVIRWAIQSGELPISKWGGRVLIQKDDLERLLRRREARR